MSRGQNWNLRFWNEVPKKMRTGFFEMTREIKCVRGFWNDI
jgi:hypothetical protein